MDILWWIMVICLLTLAFVGLVIPFIPDVLFMLGGFLIYEYFLSIEGLGKLFWITTIVLIIALFSVDYLAGGIAVKKYGGSKLSVWAAIAGIIIFPFILTPFIGILIGPMIAVFIVEWVQKKDITIALKVAVATLIGFLGSIVVKLMIMIILVVWFMMIVFSA